MAAESGRVNVCAEFRTCGFRGIHRPVAGPLRRSTPAGAVLSDPVRLEHILRRTPTGRMGRPEDLAGEAVFLSSPAAQFVTGVLFLIDGGAPKPPSSNKIWINGLRKVPRSGRKRCRSSPRARRTCDACCGCCATAAAMASRSPITRCRWRAPPFGTPAWPSPSPASAPRCRRLPPEFRPGYPARFHPRPPPDHSPRVSPATTPRFGVILLGVPGKSDPAPGSTNRWLSAPHSGMLPLSVREGYV